MYNFWFYCVLCTVMFQNIATVADDVQIINIEYNSSGKDVNIQRFLENQKFKIRLDGFPKKTYQMQCKHLYNIGWPLTFNIDVNGESSAKAIKKYMAGTWYCTIDSKKFQLKIHVLGVHWPITIINSKWMSYVIANDTTSYVDGSADYVYSTGEIIAYSCRDTPYYGHWTMAYYDVIGIKQFESYPFPTGSKELGFISRMSSKHHGSYVECIYSEGNTSNSDKYIYRTHFKMSPIPRDTGPLVIHVNGIKLVPQEDQKDSNVRVEYNYKYKIGVDLSITCENTENIKGKLQFHEKKFDIIKLNVFKEISMTPEKIELNFTRLDTGQWEQILRYYFIDEDSRSPILPSAEITISPDTLVDRDVRILGLPEENLEYQYSRGVHTWYMVYLYDAGETLDLTCLFTYKKIYTFNADGPPYLMWIIDEHYKNASNYHTNSTFNNIRYITGQFMLDSDHDNSKIVCVTQEPTGRLQAVVVLRQKPTDKNNTYSYTGIAVGIGCACAVFLSFVVAIIYKMKKRSVQAIHNYENSVRFERNEANNESELATGVDGSSNSDVYNSHVYCEVNYSDCANSQLTEHRKKIDVPNCADQGDNTNSYEYDYVYNHIFYKR